MQRFEDYTTQRILVQRHSLHKDYLLCIANCVFNISEEDARKIYNYIKRDMPFEEKFKTDVDIYEQ